MSVQGELNSKYPAGMTFQDSDFRARLEIPYPNGCFFRGRRNDAAAGWQGYVKDIVRVSAQFADQLQLVACLDFDSTVSTASDQYLPIG